MALVLSGGGARAAAQVGVIRAFVEAGVEPDLVVGTSAGAVNGAWYALFPDRIDDLEAVWLGLTKRGVFPGTMFRHGYNLMRHGHLHRFEPWGRILEKHFGGRQFEDTHIPFVAVTVRLSDGAPIPHDRGQLTSVLKAATAVPGLFPPQHIGDELHVDGAVIEFLPLPTAIRLGATTIYAIDSSDFPEGNGTGYTAMDRSAQLASTAWVDGTIDRARAVGAEIVRIRPPLGRIFDGRDFTHTSRLIDSGYEHARSVLATELPPQLLLAHPAEGRAS